jgi:two-component sensor histidine kinase
MQHLKNAEINEFSMEKRYIRKNGTIVWVLLTVSPMWQIGESPTHHIAVVQDITERKLADEKIFNLLKEKEHLLKEIHHRVKNNMHTIYSLLMVQSNSEDDSKAAKILQDAAGRVQSMMVLYDKLYRSQTDDTISIREYLPTLINEITDLFPAKDVIKIETEIDDIFLNSKVLSPLGILVNELITNTMKYAFVNRDSGIIRVTARRKENRISIEFEDNGNGIPESVSFESSKGFGLQLIGLLVKQIGGVISIDRANGTKFTIEFSH